MDLTKLSIICQYAKRSDNIQVKMPDMREYRAIRKWWVHCTMYTETSLSHENKNGWEGARMPLFVAAYEVDSIHILLY